MFVIVMPLLLAIRDFILGRIRCKGMINPSTATRLPILVKSNRCIRLPLRDVRDGLPVRTNPWAISLR